MGVLVRTGADALRLLDVRLDALHDAARTPLTARRPWLQAWVDTHPRFDPLVVTVEDDSEVHAAAVLAVKEGRGLRTVVAAGHGPSDAAALPSRDAAAAERLARATAEVLGRTRGPWRLVLRHVVPTDEAAPLLAARLGHAQYVAGDVSPVLRAAPGSTLRDHVSSSHRKGIARIRNRMVREGLQPRVEHVTDPAALAALMPEVERVYRLRDAALGRRCALDDPPSRDFFRLVTRTYAETGQVRLTTLHLQGELAAYVLCFLDGDVVRMWNPRFDPAWDRFSPGKLAMEESVDHALATGASAYDFMRGAERYKSSYANDEVRTQDLFGSSGPVVAGAVSAVLGVRARVRQAGEGDGRAARLVESSRRLRDRYGGILHG